MVKVGFARADITPPLGTPCALASAHEALLEASGEVLLAALGPDGAATTDPRPEGAG